MERHDRRRRARNTTVVVLCAVLFTTVLGLNACGGDRDDAPRHAHDRGAGSRGLDS